MTSNPTPPPAPAPAGAAPSDTRPRRHLGRGWLVLAVAAVGVMGLAWLFNGQSADPQNSRAEPFALTTTDLAAAAGTGPDAFRKTNPPIDVGLAERAAQGASLGRFSLPDARQVATYRRAETGDEVTSVVLLYDDPTQAAGLDAQIAPLLASTFQLESKPITVVGAEDARSWASPAYHAVSFRQGGVVSFIGTNRTDDPEGLMRLAEAARDRVAARLAEMAAGEAGSTDAPTAAPAATAGP